jgi:DNA-binding response OmpR family regulator
MRKFRHNEKYAEPSKAAETEVVSFSGATPSQEIEIDGVDRPSGAYGTETAPLEHPSEASGVIVVGGSMPDVEEVDEQVASQAQASSSSESGPSNSHSTSHTAQEAHGGGSQSHAEHSTKKSEHGHKRPSGDDRRKRHRALISAPVRVRPVHITDDGPSEVTTTVDVSRSGLLFVSKLSTYQNGMEVAVVFPYSAIPGEVYAEQIGHVVRHVTLADGRKGVAICFDKPPVGNDLLVDAGGRKFLQPEQVAIAAAEAAAPASPSQMLAPAEQTRAKVLIVESDERARHTMCSFLTNEGYNAMGVSSASAARDVLADTVPAVVVAEIEGDGMHGYELCTSIKKDDRLRGVPVILTTRSAYPSDYANAHAVGAIICMAKPFKQEKLGHMVRLLAPLRKKAHEMHANADSSHGAAKSRRPVAIPSSRPSQTPKAKYDRDEFSKLCQDAVLEKQKREGGDRFDCTDADAESAQSQKDAKQAEATGFKALRNKAASLFKR